MSVWSAAKSNIVHFKCRLRSDSKYGNKKITVKYKVIWGINSISSPTPKSILLIMYSRGYVCCSNDFNIFCHLYCAILNTLYIDISCVCKNRVSVMYPKFLYIVAWLQERP